MNSSFVAMDLYAAFTEYLKKESLLTAQDRPVLAVSGGLDSVVLTELFSRLGLAFTIAHCNFQLRGEESDRDEAFVRALGVKYNRPVLVERFNTNAYAEANHLSIQVAARELRYAWFRTLSNCILTAHHQDDNIETLLMNFFKGTGMAGLRAMLPRQGGIVRPLLFASRAALEDFARAEGLTWVEDSSNASDKYTRNYFRHQLIPMIEKVYPAVRSNLADNIDRFRAAGTIYRQSIDRQKLQLLEHKGKEIHIPVLKLKKTTPLATMIYEIITPLGFHPQQVDEVISLLDSPSGKYINSPTNRILKDRNWLIISPRATAEAAHIPIGEETGEVLFEQGTLLLQITDEIPEGLRGETTTANTGAGPAAAADAPAQSSGANDKAKKRSPRGGGPTGQMEAYFDASTIQWPLLLRPWRTGDYFYPLGMRKKKKLSRFFIDNKLSLADKEKVWVLEMDKKIIWVLGWRLDDRFRIGPTTSKAIKLNFRPGS